MKRQPTAGAAGTATMVDAQPAARADPGVVRTGVLTRAAYGVTLGVLAVVVVTAARAPAPPVVTRGGGRVALGELVAQEQRRVDGLVATVGDLRARVVAHQRAGGGEAGRLALLRGHVEDIGAVVGLTPLRGPAVVATLKDSSLAQSPDGDLNDLVIHEQDLQAVINALWAGSAEAMAVNGQRVLSTTAIRCIGNTLLLHGRQYSPPYVIEAVGDRAALRAALERNPAVGRLRVAAEIYELGFDVVEVASLQLPASEDLGGLDEADVRSVGDGSTIEGEGTTR